MTDNAHVRNNVNLSKQQDWKRTCAVSNIAKLSDPFESENNITQYRPTR